MRLIDLDDDRHCYVGNDGEYERWNIDPDATTIDPVKNGKWIKVGESSWRCSECTADNYYAYTWDFDNNEYKFQDNYCPNCGAKMNEDSCKLVAS